MAQSHTASVASSLSNAKSQQTALPNTGKQAKENNDDAALFMAGMASLTMLGTLEYLRRRHEN
ncbi:hypothetical protein [Eupransor demetentiae]